MLSHIPYFCSTATIVGAIVFAFNGNTQTAGLFLATSGLLYLSFSEKILTTTNEIEKKFPPLKIISKLIGGKTDRAMKMSGVALLLVGSIWIFF